MVIGKYVEDGKTISVWEQYISGDRKLQRGVYVGYYVNTVLDGRRGSKFFNTYEEAVKDAESWQNTITEKYGLQDWRFYNPIQTCVEQKSHVASSVEHKAEWWITEQALNLPLAWEEIISTNYEYK